MKKNQIQQNVFGIKMTSENMAINESLYVHKNKFNLLVD